MTDQKRKGHDDRSADPWERLGRACRLLGMAETYLKETLEAPRDSRDAASRTERIRKLIADIEREFPPAEHDGEAHD